MRPAFGRHGIAYGLATSGALLTCVAVIFNIGPFAKVPKLEPAAVVDRAIQSLRTVEAKSVSVSHADGAKDGPAIKAEPAVTLASHAAESQEPASEPSSPDPGGASLDAAATFADSRNTSRPTAAIQVSITGIWAPDTGACSVGAFRGGLLPTIINVEGAWAGETFCIFKKLDQTQRGWTVTANCSNRTERWTTRVRLTLKGERLIWASKRGTQAYTRCPPDVLMAQAR